MCISDCTDTINGIKNEDYVSVYYENQFASTVVNIDSILATPYASTPYTSSPSMYHYVMINLVEIDVDSLRLVGLSINVISVGSFVVEFSPFGRDGDFYVSG